MKIRFNRQIRNQGIIIHIPKTLSMKNPYTVYGYTLSTTLLLTLLSLSVCGQTPQLLKDISPYEGSNPSNFTLFKDKVYFSARERTDFRSFPSSLWVTDGTPQGTTRILGCNPSMKASDHPFTIIPGFMLFIGQDATNGQELWVSDGTTNGTRMVKNINPSGDTRFEELIVFNDKLYFGANDGTNDALWVSDGTATGTYKIKDFPHPNIAYITPTAFVKFDNRLFFHFDDANSYSQFWETDGTTAGTRRLNTGQNFRSPAHDFKKFKDKIVFRTGADIKVLTKDTLITLGQISGGSCLNTANQVFVFKDTLYFQGAERTLYYSDGSLEGTNKITSTLFLCRFFEASGKLYFVASNLSPEHIWTTDGTLAGTKALAQNSDYQVTDQASAMVVYKNKIYFRAYTPLSSIRPQLAVFDPLRDTVETFISAQPDEFIASVFFIVNDRLYFIGSNLNPDREPGVSPWLVLWQTDGTIAGTSSLGSAASKNGIQGYNYLFNTNDYLFFSNGDNSYWYTDATLSNPRLIRPSGATQFLGSENRSYIIFNDYFIFRGNFTEPNNDELWVLKLSDLSTSLQAPPASPLHTVYLYPNPAQNTLQINDHQLGETYDLQLYNSLGQLGASFTGVKSHQPLPISQLNNGMYWAKISNTQREWTTKKLIIAR